MKMQRIRFARKEPSAEEVVRKIKNEEIKHWFFSKFQDFTPAQKYALYYIAQGKNVLITSPTGSGKTLSAFLFAIDYLLSLAKNGKLEDKIYVIYISPLKALNNDIHRNLEEPLHEIGVLNPVAHEIRVGVRTSDTPSEVKAKMLRKPPHILITTPESLAIALNAPKFSEKLLSVKWVIVDEIHALAENKRGVHLALSLERLTYRMQTPALRIGLSATIHPLENVARFLVGYEDPDRKIPRECVILDVSFAKKMDIKVISPVSDFIYTGSEELSKNLYSTVIKHINKHRTTLIFTNTRSATERVVFHLNQALGDSVSECIGAHHSSLSRDVRLDVENGLKSGRYKAVVSSTSLELGIDIGYIDLVLLLGSPKSATRALQRIGRSGHRLHETSIGRIIVLDRDDLVECAVLAKYARERKLEMLKIPECCLDVLAQHVVGMSLEKKWKIDEAYFLVRRAMPYLNLSFEDFQEVLRYLGGNRDLEHQRVYGKLWYDESLGEFGRRGKMTRAIYYMNAGTIPDEVAIKVYIEGTLKFIGKLEEEFVERLSPGDIFVLGGRTYEFRKLRNMRAYVLPQPTRKPTVPAWFSEMLPLQYDLAAHIREFRDWMRKTLKQKAPVARIMEYLDVDRETANAIYSYFVEQSKFSGIPSFNELQIEEFIDEENLYCYVFHSLTGRRANDAMSRALAHAIATKQKTGVRVSVNDNGFMLTCSDRISLDELHSIFAQPLGKLLASAITNTEMFKRRFRHVAVRSFLILRRYGEHTKSVHYQQFDAQILIKSLRNKYPNFPVIKETYREIMEDSMDIEHASEYWDAVGRGDIKIKLLRLPMPSPFAFNIVAAGVSDIVLMADRKEYIMSLHKRLVEYLNRESNAVHV